MWTGLGVNSPIREVGTRITHTVILASVEAYLPDRNLYYLKLQYSTVGASEYIYASGPVSIPGSGASVVPVYAIGEIVSVLVDLNVGDSKDYTYTIIGRASDVDVPTDKPKWRCVPYSSFFSDVWKGIGNLCTAIKSHISPSMANKNRNHTQPLGLLPGDLFIGSVEGPSMLAGKHVLKAGVPNCNVIFDDINNRKQTSAYEVFTDTVCVSDHTIMADLDYFRETYISIDALEGSGFSGVDPEEFNEYYTIPRVTKLEGTFIDGSLTIVSIPEEGVNEETYEVTSTPVAHKYIRYDGRISEGSAAGLTLQKSLLMQFPYRIGDATSFSTDTIAPDLSEEEENEVTEDYIATESLHYEDQAGVICASGVEANPDSWAIQDPEDTDVPEQTTTPEFEVSGTSTYDPLPETMVLTDPKTGKQKTYYASNAFLKFQDDGSIILADGYGSEIRMYRGNIYISPKADLICTPGRDYMTMAGRNLAIKGYKDVQINSTQSDVYIKAEQNMRLLSGASGEAGYLTIENRCPDPVQGGLILRGNHSLGITAQNIYMGLTTGTDITAGQLDTKAVGSIVINAGSGSVNMQGTAVHSTGADVTLAGYDAQSGTGSVLSLQAAQATLNAGTTVVSTKGLFFGPVEKPLEVQGLDNSGEVVVVTGVTAQGGNDSIQIDGHVMLTGNVATNGTIVANTGMYSRSGGFVNANPEYSGMAIRDEGFNDISIETASTPEPANLESAWTVHSEGIGQASVLTGERFIYPASEDLGINPGTYNIPGMRWQAFLKDATVWAEEGLVDPIEGSISMVYPGMEAWEQGTITIGMEDEPYQALGESFVINAKE